MDFLAHISQYKKAEITQLQTKQAANKFARLFNGEQKTPIFISEIKPRSPSEGILYDGDLVKLASTYQAAGVSAISVLTDTPSFGGSLQLLRQVKQAVDLPILRKDFILDESQLVESLQYQADAVLLIVSLVSPSKLKELITFAYRLGLLPIVEISSPAEAKIAVKAGAKVIGVNARDLHSFKVDLPMALRIIANLPDHIVPLLFSGIKTREDVEQAHASGARGVLVGTSLLRAKDIGSKIKELKNENDTDFIVKVCGIKSLASAHAVIEHRPTMIGLNFVPHSPRLVDEKTAQAIAKLAHAQHITVVGVFQNQPLREVQDFIKSVPLDYVQLHGEESVAYCNHISTPIIKRIKLDGTLAKTKALTNSYRRAVAMFLVDRTTQGQGKMPSISKVKELTKEYPVIIAGGLHKDNVGNVIREIGTKLAGVDVSSGLEHAVGEKDKQLTESFIKNARAVL